MFFNNNNNNDNNNVLNQYIIIFYYYIINTIDNVIIKNYKNIFINFLSKPLNKLGIKSLDG